MSRVEQDVTSHTDVPAHRRPAVERVAEMLRQTRQVVLTTHVNADGDGTGSQAALADWLQRRGARVHIVNPTPYPHAFRFLLEDPGMIADAGSVAADRALAGADLIIVVDTAEPKRIGRVAKAVRGKEVVVIDHHVEGPTQIEGAALVDVDAAAAGELVYDVMTVLEPERPWPQQVLGGIYTALVTDTGSFRFSNTTPRAHAITADLITQGIDPEEMYRRIYATVPLRRIQLLRHALERLDVEADHAITSITIERGVMERLGATSEDLDGIIEHARSIEGTEIALLLRETSDGATKVSFRSAGVADVNALARQFGGGGHVKAAGALIAEPLESARPRVLAAARAALRSAGTAFPDRTGTA